MKPRFIFRLTSNLSADGHKELDDDIFSCGSMISSATIYTATHLRCIRCSSKVKHAYYSAPFVVKQVCVHCGTQDIQQASFKRKCVKLKTVFPTCRACQDKGYGEVCLEKTKRKGRQTAATETTTSIGTAPISFFI